jgi:hypothetical protein
MAMLFNEFNDFDGSNDSEIVSEWSSLPLRLLGKIEKSSHQVFQKNNDGSIEGIQYNIVTEPSTFRPVKSWVINLEKWVCDAHADIMVEDILSLRLNNDINKAEAFEYRQSVRHLKVKGKRHKLTDQNAFNAVMAMMVCISKINVGQFPNIDKILSMHNL